MRATVAEVGLPLLLHELPSPNQGRTGDDGYHVNSLDGKVIGVEERGVVAFILEELVDNIVSSFFLEIYSRGLAQLGTAVAQGGRSARRSSKTHNASHFISDESRWLISVCSVHEEVTLNRPSHDR